jgi:antirestriction protein ArdC
MTLSFDGLMAEIIMRLEAGVPPWRQAWNTLGADPSEPLRATGEPFTGSNAWLLSFAGAMAGFTSPYWFTFRQALAIGAPVRKGAKATPAILYKTRVVEEPAAPVGEDAEARVLRYLKIYGVFNAEQLTDCPAAFLRAPPVDRVAREAARSTVLDAIPSQVEFGGGTPYYIPALDLIRMPPPERFRTVEDFLATKAHEQLHWSGAEHRLARAFGRRFGDEAYAFEEMVAEIGAAALGLRIGLPPRMLDDHAAYLGHWVKILKARPGALLEASGHAQRAVDYLLAFSQGGRPAEGERKGPAEGAHPELLEALP